MSILMEKPVYITEKVEGSNWWATIDAVGQIRVGQRNYEIIDVVEYQHDWLQSPENTKSEEKLHQLWDESVRCEMMFNSWHYAAK